MKIRQPTSKMSKRMSSIIQRAMEDAKAIEVHTQPEKFIDPTRQYIRIIIYSNATALEPRAINIINDTMSSGQGDILIRIKRSPF